MRALIFFGFLHDVKSGDGACAGAGSQQAAQHANCCRLAGTVGAEESEYLAAIDLKSNVIDGGELAEIPAQIRDINGAVWHQFSGDNPM